MYKLAIVSIFLDILSRNHLIQCVLSILGSIWLFISPLPGSSAPHVSSEGRTRPAAYTTLGTRPAVAAWLCIEAPTGSHPGAPTGVHTHARHGSSAEQVRQAAATIDWWPRAPMSESVRRPRAPPMRVRKAPELRRAAGSSVERLHAGRRASSGRGWRSTMLSGCVRGGGHRGCCRSSAGSGAARRLRATRSNASRRGGHGEPGQGGRELLYLSDERRLCDDDDGA